MKGLLRKTTKKMSSATAVILMILCCIVIAAAAFGFLHQYRKTQERLNTIRHASLSILTESIDHSLYMLLSRSQSNLKIIAGADSPGRAALELEFLQNGKSEAFETTVKETFRVQSSIFDRVVIRIGDQAVFSTDGSDRLEYEIRGRSESNNYAIAMTENGSYYLAVSTDPTSTGLIYTGMIPVEELYRKMMVDSVNDNFWVVLYDSTGSIVLQNEDGLPAVMTMDWKEALSRNDGLSYLVQSEIEGQPKMAEYTYSTANDETEQPILAYCLPASCSENQAFSIGLHMDNSSVQAISRQSMNNALLFAILLVLAGTVLAVLMMRFRGRQERADRELAELKEKNALAEQLLATQTEISHHQRMESLGVLTAGIAHEFNNLLTPIIGHSLMAIQNIDDENSPLFTNAMETYSAAQKAKNLVARISSLTRKNLDNQLQELSVNGLVHSALELTQPSQPENVECVTDLKAEHMLRCNEVQMHQFLMNLIINAYHAMKETGGTLTIATASDGRNVTVTVSDTGPGIPDEEKERIFDPFYTTKAPGKGTGLGLPLALSAVQAHGGTLTVTDTPGHGATFTAVFPLDFKGTELKDSADRIEHGTR